MLSTGQTTPTGSPSAKTSRELDTAPSVIFCAGEQEQESRGARVKPLPVRKPAVSLTLLLLASFVPRKSPFDAIWSAGVKKSDLHRLIWAAGSILLFGQQALIFGQEAIIIWAGGSGLSAGHAPSCSSV